MKKLLFGFILGTSFLSICSFTYYNKKNEPYGWINLCEYKLNGHYYVVANMSYYHGGVSIIHSPNCKCK